MPENQNSLKQNSRVKSGDGLAHGVLFLTLSNLLVKVMGMLFKIPLTNLIGEEGMAYYNLAYNIFKWFYMISTAGLPVAISILIARSRARRRENETAKIDRIALLLFFTIGCVCTGAMLFLSGKLAAFEGAPDARYALCFIAPSILFICVTSCARGYFQGFGELVPPALSQLVEAGAKLLLGMLFAWYSITVRHDPIYITAAFAIGGSTVGTFLSMLSVGVCKWFYRPTFDIRIPPDRGIMKSSLIARRLLQIALPITLSASVMSLTDLIDSAMIINRLTDAAGVSHQTALRLYGNYSSLAVPMYNLPLALIYPLCGALVPAITAADTKKNRTRFCYVVSGAISAVSALAIPAAMGLSVMALPILRLLFQDAAAATGAPLLAVLSPSVFFVGMVSVTNTVLQATGNERLPIISMVAGACVKLVLDYLLCGLPQIGILGAPLSTSVCYFCIMVINLWFTVKKTGTDTPFSAVFLKPFIAGTACAVTAPLVYMPLRAFAPDGVSCLVAIAAAGFVCLAALYLMKGLSFLKLLQK